MTTIELLMRINPLLRRRRPDAELRRRREVVAQFGPGFWENVR